jgi:hypothetical protein
MESLLALFTLICGGLSLLCLLGLHVTSAEFHPSWRMISEYSLGRHKWLLTTFFLLWASSSLFLSALLWGQVESGWAKFGVMLLVLSAIGEALGGLYDMRHKLHGVAFGLGVPSFPISALLIGYHLAGAEGWNEYAGAILFVSHLTWISVVAMGIAMVMMIAGFKRAGVPVGPGVSPPERLSPGVIAIGGYLNRVLVLCDIGWLLLVTWIYLSLRALPAVGGSN